MISINEFAKEFDEIVLITGSIRVQDISLNNKVKVSYISKYNRGNAFKKSVSWFLGTVEIYLLLITRYRKFEKFYFSIPPTSYLMAFHFRAPYAVLVFDLYPEALLSFGFTRDNLLYKWWSKRNRRIFAGACRIFTLSEKMKSQILEYSREDKVSVIPNWSAFAGFSRVDKREKQFNCHI